MKTLTPIKQDILTQKEKFNLLLMKFLNGLDVSESTKTAYEKALRCFIAYLKDSNIPNLSREDILTYKHKLSDNLSPSTINLYLTAVRRLFGWLEAEKIYPNIAKDVKGYKRPKGYLKNELKATQVRRLLDSIEKNTIKDIRDFALINLMVRTGLRTIEVIRADIGDIESKGGTMILRVWGKNRDEKDDFVLLVDETYFGLLDYIKARKDTEPEEPLFISHSNHSSNDEKRLSTRSIRRIVGERLKRAGLKTDKITAHSLRHTAGSLAIECGADVVAVKDMLRHSDINTTMIYVHNSNRIKKGAERFIKF